MTSIPDDSVIVVTGAASGIGLAIARAAAEAGARQLVLTDIDASRLRVAADSLAIGTTAEILGADLSDPMAAKEIVERARQAFGRIDGLVNSAGLTTRGGIATAP